MADTQRQREMVFCHQCENEWYRDEHGLVCPGCESEFTEVIERDHDPRDLHASAPSLSPHPFHDHDPWADDVPDPEEGDVSRVEYSSGPGGVTVTRTMFRSSTPIMGRGRNGPNSPTSPIIENFTTMLQGILGPQAGLTQRRPGPHSPRPSSSAERGFPAPYSPLQEGPGRPGLGDIPPPGMAGGRFAYNSTARLWPRDANNPQPRIEPVDDLHGILGVLFQNLNDMHPGNVENPRAGGAPVQNPFAALFAPFLNPAAAASGDAVYTQEALDRVISQLMEQHTSGNAPGPASAAAIAALPRKKMDTTMLDDSGTAQCSVCMEDVPIGQEVTLLPCSHWFHHECIAMWLKEHDTCPHCRAGITAKDGEPAAPRAPGQAPLHSQNSFASQNSDAPLGSRDNPFRLPGESPRDGRYTHVEFRRRRSSQNTSRSSNEGNSGGGITGRMRNWLGGGSSSGGS
ncbi:MAG: hypothetical protein M1836_005197 [Candelina mexicana]|nr:MAG: hypothetical protein M1836_005197 [Candelina mexicana]